MDPIIVDTPDGGTAEFPAGTPPDVIKGALAKRFPKPAAAPAERSTIQQVGDLAGDQAVWQRTRAINAGTALAGQNPVVEPIRRAIGSIDWQTTAKEGPPSLPMYAMAMAQPIISRLMKYAYPDTATQRDVIYNDAGVRKVDLPGTAGRIVDAGVEAAITGPLFQGGAVRNTVAGFGAGVGSETAGKLTEGSRWEPGARFAGGLVGGLTGTGIAEAGNAVVKGVRNTFGANNVDQTASRIINRGFERDKIAPAERRSRIESLGDDAMPVDAGGANVKGVLRGATAAPGEARTTVQGRFDERAAGEVDRLSASVNRNVSPKGFTQTVDDLIKQRNTEPKPLYDVALNRGQVWSPRVQQFLDDPLFKPALAKGLEIQRIEALARGERFDPKAYGITSFADDGTPIISGTPNMRALNATKKGIDAIMEGYRDKTSGRMVLDEKGRAIDEARRAFVKELDTLNPDYAAARKAYAEPSQLKDAAEMGRRLFAGREPVDVVRREFGKLSDQEKEAFRVGVAEHLRKIVDARDATGAAARVAGGKGARERLIAVLGDKEGAAILRDLATERGFTKTQRQVGINSNTVPAGLEAADNAAQIAGGAVVQAAQGHPVSAVMTALSGFSRRVAQGQNERVNARIAEMLTNGSPEARRALIDALEQSLLDQRIAAPGNTLRAGAGAALPSVNQSMESRRDKPRR